MTLFAQLAGVQVLSGQIVIPYMGAPHADVTLSKEAALAASGLTLILGKFAMKCSPWRTPIAFQGKTQVRLIGGAGGWRKVIPAEGYALSNGTQLKLSFILGACAKLVGETLVVDASFERVIGTHYARDKASASVNLNTLAPSSWYIGLDGVTRIGARAATAVTSPFTIVSFDGARGAMTIATDFPEDIIPGRTLKGTTIAKPITIGGVTHMITAGKIRTEVLAA